mgnify:CR=1 FL=1
MINLEGENKDYKKILCDFFVELKDYINQERDKIAESIDERINEQMVIPAEDNHLCFISCAMFRISQLSAMLNPILHSFGITPVRIDDMLTHGTGLTLRAQRLENLREQLLMFQTQIQM